MELKKLLKEIGLSSYETAVYLKLVELGVAEASAIYKEAKVPFGRVYEELNSLVNKGLVEVQNTRPKKYMVKKPKIAFNNLLERKKDDMENQFQKATEIISQVEDDISKLMPIKLKEKAFWTVAVGHNEIAEMMRYNFDEAEKELCVIIRGNADDRKKSLLAYQEEIITSLTNAIKRGVKLKILVGKGFVMPENILDKEKLKFLLSKVEIKSNKEYAKSYFEICDNSKVMIKIDNPANEKEILAIIRVNNIKLAQELRKKFDELWISAKPFKI